MMIDSESKEGVGLWRGSRRWVIVAVILVALAALFAVLAWGLANRSPVTGRSGITRVGKPAPEFAFKTFGGDEFTLSEYIGRPVVINFWASWCVPCRSEAATLESAWRASRGAGVTFVGVATDDSIEDAREFVRSFGVTYQNGLDADGVITVGYGVIGLPVTFFVNRDGIIERRWVGEIPGPRLAIWLEDLVEGRDTGENYGENRETFFEIGEPAR